MRRLHALDALAALLAAAGAIAWTYGILRRYFDYDELEHLYAIWRIHSGDRPFTDFFEGHPPFAWYALAPALGAFNLISFPLFPLRFLTAAGHVVLLVALGKNVALSFSRLERPVALSWTAFVIGVLMFAGHLSVLWYLLEFRLDAWPNALMFLAVHRYRRRIDRPFPGALRLAFVCGLTLLCSPKLALFFALFCLCSLAAEGERRARAAGLAVGSVGAAAAGGLMLLVAGVSPRLVYQLCVTYHAMLAARGGFGHGLAVAIGAQAPLLMAAVASLAGWLLVVGRRLRAFPFELAVVAFLVIQPAFVAFGFPQYYAPWFLLAMIFVPYLELGLRRVPAAHRLAIVAGFVVAGANVVVDLRTFGAVDQTAPVVAFNAWARTHVPPEATVAGDLLGAPIYRRSVFYHLAGSRQPNGYTTEEAMRDMRLTSIGERMTSAAYDRELEAGRPALIVPSRLLSPLEHEAIERYRARHRAEYRAVTTPAGPVDLRL